MQAACHDGPGAVSTIRVLLDYGADIQAGADRGLTALIEAAAWGNETVARELLDRGADANAGAEWGMTAVAAARDGGHSTLVALLLERSQGE